MLNLEEHLKRQIAFSRATFGPGERRKGVVDHIRKKLEEIESGNGDPVEWVDVVILALDGLTRKLIAEGLSHDRAAYSACLMIISKQGRNEVRDWPDWRTSDPDKAIEHVRGGVHA